MAQKRPLMLKDYLELDSDSEFASGSAFRRAPLPADTVRCLLEAELCHGGGERTGRRQLIRGTPSMNAALTKLFYAINAVKLLSFSSSGGGSEGHSGSFSRRMIRGSFWKSKRVGHQEETGDKVRVRDIVRLRSPEEDADEGRSFVFSSPVVSHCSTLSEAAFSSSSASDFLPSSVASSENLDDIAAIPVSVESKKEISPPSTPKRATEAVAGSHRPPPKEVEAEGPESPECHMEEDDKEQLSPVSVMDFPYEEDDDDDVDEEEEEEEDDEDEDDLEEESCIASPCFTRCLANIERTKLQLLQKIRRFESLAELDAVDLESRFDDLSGSGDEHETASDAESDRSDGVTSSTPETRAWVLLEQLCRGPHRDPPLGCFEKLLLDFLVEGLRRFDDDDHAAANLGSPARFKGAEASSAQREESMLRAARDWMWGDVDGRRREATTMEMEVNGRWRSRREEAEELGADVEGYVFGLLVEEMVVHLTSS